jgi:hypothetical protein
MAGDGAVVVSGVRNLTGHPVVIHLPGAVLRIEPSGTVARCVQDVVAGPEPATVLVNGVPVPVVIDGLTARVAGLPPARDGILLIVSRLVALAAPGRRDLVFPHGPVRDGDGRTMGCRALAQVPAQVGRRPDPRRLPRVSRCRRLRPRIGARRGCFARRNNGTMPG